MYSATQYNRHDFIETLKKKKKKKDFFFIQRRKSINGKEGYRINLNKKTVKNTIKAPLLMHQRLTRYERESQYV